MGIVGYRAAAIILSLALGAAGCSRETAAPGRQGAESPGPPTAVVLVTIDTLRADRVGAYGHAGARTPAMDRLARDGVRFDRAYATAPITLTSHASLMTGRYPPGHAARHNGMRLDLKTPTIAEAFARAGFKTAAFVTAFPLDRRFGLIKGFEEYHDRMPRGADGRIANERPGRLAVDEALAWLGDHQADRVFLWVHLFEPHAPYGNPSDPAQARRPALARYDEDIAEADAQVARLLAAFGTRGAPLAIVTSDHGEAFGEHGEISHSLFTYDTTLRVPLIVSGGAAEKGGVVAVAVSLVDVAPTIASLAGLPAFAADGRVLLPAHAADTGGSEAARSLYAESFAPLLDFGWSPLRALRSGDWKYIAAPTPELYDVRRDPGETRNVIAENAARASNLARQVDAMSPPSLAAGGRAEVDREALARLQALGYASGRAERGGPRPDPKDRRELAADLARIASGELQGDALERALRAVLRADPKNPQANVRLGQLLLESDRCREAVPHFTAAIDGHLPSADAHLGRAACETQEKDTAAARRTLTAAQRVEPDNPVVIANLGLLISDGGQPSEGIPHLQRALSLDPDLHQARFGLAVAYARAGRRADAAKEAEELLRRLPSDASQRPEVERLLATVRSK
jgi:arylsulfatase A-like enzyme/thioredoxin-like negative regulator of GroEL